MGELKYAISTVLLSSDHSNNRLIGLNPKMSGPGISRGGDARSPTVGIYVRYWKENFMQHLETIQPFLGIMPTGSSFRQKRIAFSTGS
jgi:hypothetical protein